MNRPTKERKWAGRVKNNRDRNGFRELGLGAGGGNLVPSIPKCKHGLSMGTCWTCKTGERIQPEKPGTANLCALLSAEGWNIRYGMPWFTDYYGESGGPGGMSPHECLSHYAQEEDDPKKPYYVTKDLIFVCRNCRMIFDSWHRVDKHTREIDCEPWTPKPKEIEDEERQEWEEEAQRIFDRTGIRPVYLKSKKTKLEKEIADLPKDIREEIAESYSRRKHDLMCMECFKEVPILLNGSCYQCFLKKRG